MIEVSRTEASRKRHCIVCLCVSVSPAYPHVRSFDRSQSVVAGRSLVLDCRAWGWPAPNVSWYRGPLELTPEFDSRVTLSKAPGRPPGSRLTIDGVEQSDRDYYTCVAWSSSDEWGGSLRQNNATVLVRVKGTTNLRLCLIRERRITIPCHLQRCS